MAIKPTKPSPTVVEVDETLEVSGTPADSKTVGDKLDEKVDVKSTVVYYEESAEDDEEYDEYVLYDEFSGEVNQLKEDLLQLKNTTETPEPAGKVWGTTASGAGWVEQQDGETVTDKHIIDTITNYGFYKKPTDGIPASDLAPNVIPTPYDDSQIRAEISAKYTKPSTGIPASDLESGVIPNVPTALPNPNALTFTGAVVGSYDGSAPLSIEIPSGVQVDETLTEAGQAADAAKTGAAINELNEDLTLLDGRTQTLETALIGVDALADGIAEVVGV